MTASVKARTAVLPASFSCKAISVHSKPKPCGSFSFARLRRRDALTGGKTTGQANLDLRRRIKIVARHAERPRRVLQLGYRTERHHSPLALRVFRLATSREGQRKGLSACAVT